MNKICINKDLLQTGIKDQNKKLGFRSLLNLSKTNLQNSTRQKCSVIDAYSLFNKINQASEVIRNYFLVWLSSKLLKDIKIAKLLQAKHASATKIQSSIRCFLAFKHYKYLQLTNSILSIRQSAAFFIQRNYKIFLLTKKLHFLYLQLRISSIRNLAAICIQKIVKGYLVRKDLYFIKNRKLLLLITWEKPANLVYIIGDFTNPPWMHQIPLLYSKTISLFYSAFFLENHIHPGRYFFKFCVDGIWLCDDKRPKIQDREGNLINFLTVLLPSYVTKPVSNFDFHAKTIENLNYKSRNLLKNLQTDVFSLRLCIRSFSLGCPEKLTSKLNQNHSADICMQSEELQMFALADGVSEWLNFGIDPSAFPSELITNVFQAASRFSLDLKAADSEICSYLESLLTEAYQKTQAFGSATILIGLFLNNKLYTLSLGNVEIIIIEAEKERSKLKVNYRSKKQEHSYCCPFQLSRIPEQKECEELMDKGLETLASIVKVKKIRNDMPKDAQSGIITIEAGDIIIVGSNGLFDNLFEEDFIEISQNVIRFGLEKKEFCAHLAEELVRTAISKGWDAEYKSPFYKNGKQHGERMIGGKLDDTSAIVSIAELLSDTEN
jgi:serine/threonine protein phosphatase PrpC